MYTAIEDFTAEWTAESKVTTAVLACLTDASLTQAIADGRRTLGQIAWHLARSLEYMATLGLRFDGTSGGDEAPPSAASIAAEYGKVSASLLHAVQTQWNDASLLESQLILGEPWTNGNSLRFLILHQAHHRGQMTVLMRQAGLSVPDIYGPTYESWIDKGLTPRL